MSLSRIPRRATAGAVVTAAVLAAAATPSSAQTQPERDYDPRVTYVVDSVGDEHDARLGDRECWVDARRACTLRAALQEANADRAASEILFRLGAGTVTLRPQTQLPALRDLAGPTTIDGASVIGTSEMRVEIRGPGAGSTVDGLAVTSHGNEVRELAIFGFRNQIRVTGWANRVIDNVLGTNRAGTFKVSATQPFDDRAGVLVEGDAANNLIADSAIAGNAGHGVLIRGTATSNTVTNNRVGIGFPGFGARPNLGHGIVIGPDTRLNVVGGGNHIAANGGNGVVAGGTLSRITRNVLGRRAMQSGDMGIKETLLPNGAADIVVGPSAEARIRENQLWSLSGGVVVDTKATTGAWIVRNQIGAAVPGYPWTAGTGVEVRGGTDGVVAYNDIARQRIGLRLFLPVLQVDNRFQDNGQDVVGP